MTRFVDLDEAARQVVSGDRLAVGGCLFTRAPLALLDRVIRSGARDLEYRSWGGGLPLELLLEAGSVRKIAFCFSSLDVFGLAPRFRQALESGAVEVEELPALAMVQGFTAAGQRLPSLPFTLPIGSDVLDRTTLAGVANDPVTVAPVGYAEALHVDCFLLHAQRADEDGNVEIHGALGQDLTVAAAARTVIVTVEEVVPAGTFQHDRRAGEILPRAFVDTVTECPLGAYPTSCPAYYMADYRTLMEVIDSEPLALAEPVPERVELVRAGARVTGEDVRRTNGTARCALPDEPTPAEIMVCCLAREYSDESVCSAGAVSPLATASYLLAKRTHAPGMTIITTSGGLIDVGPRPALLALGEILDTKSAVRHMSGDGSYHLYYQAGSVSHEVIMAAQIDRSGATNNIEVVTPSGRRVRLPGQGGMADVANMHQNFLLYVTRHSPLAFVERVDIVSAARGLLGDQERRDAGLRPGTVRVVTNLCVFELDHASRRLHVVALHPGVELDDVQQATGFDVVAAADCGRTPLPGERELALLRTEIDPLGVCRLEFVAGRDRAGLLHELIDGEAAWLEEIGSLRSEPLTRI
jgi:glutaconate CoA-transferase subunit A